MKKLILCLTLVFALAAAGIASADTVTVPGATAAAAAPAAVVATPAVATAPATVATAAPVTAQQLPQFALPAQHDLMSIVAWAFAILLPWLIWLIDTIMPFLPGPANGILHGITLMFKTPTLDPQTNTLTVQLNELKDAIAELKGSSTTSTGA